MNIICLIGRAGTKPAVRPTPSGGMVTNFNLAVKKREETIWVRLVAWNKTAELIGDYVNKGDLIGITGRLDVREYEKGGDKRQVYEVVVDEVDFLTSKKSEQKPETETVQPADFDNDLPF